MFIRTRKGFHLIHLQDLYYEPDLSQQPLPKLSLHNLWQRQEESKDYRVYLYFLLFPWKQNAITLVLIALDK